MRVFFGSLLLGCGVLIAALSGLCTLVVLAGSLSGSDASIWGIALVFGGLPLIAGIGLILLGRKLIRQPREESKAVDHSDVFD